MFVITPFKKEVCDWEESNSYTSEQNPSEERRQLKGRFTRGLSWTEPTSPSFPVSFAISPTSFQLGATGNLIQGGYCDSFT